MTPSRLQPQPSGLWLLSATEALERSAYFGVRGLLILFLTATPLAGGLGWSQGDALRFYGIYNGLAWFAPVIGGWLADRYIGHRAGLRTGLILLAVGQLTLAFSAALPAIFGLAALSYRLTGFSFYAGLLLIICGNGMLKPNITVVLGALYAANDARRRNGFTLFYMSISIGVVLASFGPGTFGERYGWWAGFAFAGGTMVIAILIFTSLQARFVHVVETPLDDARRLPAEALMERQTLRGTLFVAVLAGFATIFWTATEQSGGLLNLYTFHRVDREFLGVTIPATWLLAAPALFCVIFGILLPPLLTQLRSRGALLDIPSQFRAGLCVGALAFFVTAIALEVHGVSEPLPIGWLILFYMILSLGEMIFAPAGFSMVSEVVPPRAQGRVMGLWLLSIAFGGVIGGFAGALASTVPLSTAMTGFGLALLVAGLALGFMRNRLLRLIATPR